MRETQLSSCDLFQPTLPACFRRIAERNGIRSKFSQPCHPPRRPKIYASQLGCPLVFNSPINAIEIERRDLYAVKRGIDRHVYALLATYAEYLLAKSPRSGSIREAV